MSGEIFISCVSADLARARRVRRALEEAGFHCWMAPEDVPTNGSYAEAVERAIETAAAVVMILSATSVGSPQVRLEARQAREHRRPIVLVRTPSAPEDGPLLDEMGDIDIGSFADDDLALGEMAAHVQALVEIRDAPAPPIRRRAPGVSKRPESQTPAFAALLLKHPQYRSPSADSTVAMPASYGGASRAGASRGGGLVFWLSAVAVGALAAGLLWKLAGPGGLVAKLVAMSVAPPGTPAAVTDEVDVSVFSPTAAAPGEAVLVQALLHVVETAPQFVVGLATDADPATIRREAATLAVEVARGERLEIAIDCAGLDIEAPVQEATWRGRPLVVPFLVRAKADVGAVQAPVRVQVLRQGAPVGDIRFTLDIGPERGPRETQVVGEEAVRFGLPNQPA